MIAKTKKTKEPVTSRDSGNYQVVGDGNGYGLSIAQVKSPELFNHFYRDEKLQERARVVVYMDEDAMNSERGFAINLATGLVRFGGSYFKTRIVTRQEPEAASYAENADVVINGFREPNEAFLDELEGYNDGTKEILNISDIYDKTKRLLHAILEDPDNDLRRYDANVQALATYVHRLRNDLQTKKGRSHESLERIVA